MSKPKKAGSSSVTIYQVAAAAGVSTSTVSNYLNGRSGRMHRQTMKRVEETIAALGYRPNRAAQQLRTGRIQVIGLVAPSVANPFWGTFARHFEGAALAAGYHLLLCNSERDPERERSYLQELWDDGIRGVALCTSLPSLAHVAPLLDRGLRLVAFDRTAQPGDPDTLVNVSVDNVIGAGLAARHLLELGHRRIAFVSGSLHSINRSQRFQGFANALTEAGLSVERDAVVWSGGLDRDDGYFGDQDIAGLGRRAAAELLADPEPPTAIMAINDMCALGVCAGVRDAGLRVGTDVSVVGFDDIVLADLAAPPLTTIRQPLARLATTAFDKLREAMDGTANPESGQSVFLRPELVVRESSGRPGRRRRKLA